MKHQPPDIWRTYLYVKDAFEPQYQLFINAKEKIVIKELKDPRTFIDYSQAIGDVQKNLEDYNPTKKRKVLIVFGDKIADMEANKKLSLTVN